MIAVMPVFCLSLHAGYFCRHSGACCTAGWDIPAEPAVERIARTQIVVDEPVSAPLFLQRPGEVLTVAKRDDGSCVFFEPQRGRLCAIHRQAGAQSLPSACRYFPRVVVRDPRGTFVTLSHFCPTAAALLLDPGPLRIVDAPASIALGGSLEGLDASSVLPPLLRPGVLMDYEGLSAWERAGIAVLDRDDFDVDSALGVLAVATAAVMRWSPGNGSLALSVEQAFADALGAAKTPQSKGDDRPLRAFVAAHLFASWAAYQKGGLLAIVDDARTALLTLRREMQSQESFTEAVRAADLRLRHL
jgi:Fe-S-cluster containining protein